jgi:hypothetical protein
MLTTRGVTYLTTLWSTRATGLRKQRCDHQPLLVGQVRRVSPELASELSRTATRLGIPHTKLESRHLIAGNPITPRLAHRRVDQGIEDVQVGGITVGDRLLVRGSEVVPVDGLSH